MCQCQKHFFFEVKIDVHLLSQNYDCKENSATYSAEIYELPTIYSTGTLC